VVSGGEETMTTTTTNGWDKDRVQTLLRTNDRALVKALLVVYRNQTAREQDARCTIYRNDVGFTAADGSRGAKWAKVVLSNATLYPGTMRKLRGMMPKYWRQILVAIEAKNERQASAA